MFLIVQRRKGMNNTTSSHSSKRIRFAQLFLEKTFVGPKRSAAPGNVKAVMDRSINGKSENGKIARKGRKITGNLSGNCSKI